jgi:uncharacterized membrane protein YfcA
VTGFGCTVLALPFVTALLGLREGVMVLTILAFALAAYMAISKRRDIDLKQYGIILAFVALGLPAGMLLFRRVDVAPLKKALAAFIVLASIAQLAKLAWAGKKAGRLPRPLAYALLVLGGVVHGMFSSGGPLVVLYASEALPEKGRFRATLCLLWTTLNAVIIGSYLASGSLGAGTAGKTALLIPFLAAGIVIGERLHDRVDQRAFSLVVFAALLATGAVMLVV